MPLVSGTKLGPYEIQSPLGAGRMCEVYRANDERLAHDVAITVLPAGTLTDQNFHKRFRKFAAAVLGSTNYRCGWVVSFDRTFH